MALGDLRTSVYTTRFFTQRKRKVAIKHAEPSTSETQNETNAETSTSLLDLPIDVIGRIVQMLPLEDRVRFYNTNNIELMSVVEEVSEVANDVFADIKMSALAVDGSKLKEQCIERVHKGQLNVSIEDYGDVNPDGNWCKFVDDVVKVSGNSCCKYVLNTFGAAIVNLDVDASNIQPPDGLRSARGKVLEACKNVRFLHLKNVGSYDMMALGVPAMDSVKHIAFSSNSIMVRPFKNEIGKMQGLEKLTVYGATENDLEFFGAVLSSLKHVRNVHFRGFVSWDEIEDSNILLLTFMKTLHFEMLEPDYIEFADALEFARIEDEWEVDAYSQNDGTVKLTFRPL